MNRMNNILDIPKSSLSLCFIVSASLPFLDPLRWRLLHHEVVIVITRH
jgi:hypothetical protein